MDPLTEFVSGDSPFLTAERAEAAEGYEKVFSAHFAISAVNEASRLVQQVGNHPICLHCYLWRSMLY